MAIIMQNHLRKKMISPNHNIIIILIKIHQHMKDLIITEEQSKIFQKIY